jgi:hypothetical protein
MRTINEIAADIAFTSKSKGFDAPNMENINQKLLLAVSEICEAQEQLRDGYGLNEIYYETDPRKTVEPKPEGFPIELADAIIRLFHIGHAVGIDLNAVIEQKIAYNKTRPEKHGRHF